MTLLTGSAGAGGKGVFLLDVSQVDHTGVRVLWEFTHKSMGNVLNKPVVAKMNNGRWAVIVNNGYNNSESLTGLFIVFLDPDLSDGWTNEEDYWFIPVGNRGYPNQQLDSGLSALTVVDTFDVSGRANTDKGIASADSVYAGDLFGNLWVFDLSSSRPREWDVAFKKPLYKAMYGDQFQPITAAPEVLWMGVRESECNFNDEINNQNCSENLLVMFGTGKLFHQKDRYDVSQQSFYAVYDTHTNMRYVLERKHLTNADMSLKNSRFMNKGALNNELGWYSDFIEKGERLVFPPEFDESKGIVQYQTLTPDNTDCSSGIASRYYYVTSSGGEPLMEGENVSSVRESFDFDGIEENDLGFRGVDFQGGRWPLLLNTTGEVVKNLSEDGDFTPGILHEIEVF